MGVDIAVARGQLPPVLQVTRIAVPFGPLEDYMK
jgi:hypothetical protein